MKQWPMSIWLTFVLIVGLIVSPFFLGLAWVTAIGFSAVSMSILTYQKV